MFCVCVTAYFRSFLTDSCWFVNVLRHMFHRTILDIRWSRDESESPWFRCCFKMPQASGRVYSLVTLITFLFCLVATILHIVAFATAYWLISDGNSPFLNIGWHMVCFDNCHHPYCPGGDPDINFDGCFDFTLNWDQLRNDYNFQELSTWLFPGKNIFSSLDFRFLMLHEMSGLAQHLKKPFHRQHHLRLTPLNDFFSWENLNMAIPKSAVSFLWSSVHV